MVFRNRRYNNRKSYRSRRVKRTLRRKMYKKSYRRVPRAVTTLANIPSIQKLRYVDYTYISAATGSLASRIYRANSLYDPDYTGTGHQPMRFDQLSALFARYIVLGSKITVTWQGAAAADVTPAVCTLVLDDDVTPPTNYQEVIEQGKSKYMMVNNNGSRTPQRISQTFSAKKFFGLNNVKDNQSPYGALCTASPADDAYFTLSLQSILGLSGGVTAVGYFMVTIDYIALFSEPITLAQS